MDDELEKLIAAREKAIEKVRAWWDAANLNGQFRDPTHAPAWPEYMAAFDALDRAREAFEALDKARKARKIEA